MNKLVCEKEILKEINKNILGANYLVPCAKQINEIFKSTLSSSELLMTKEDKVEPQMLLIMEFQEDENIKIGKKLSPFDRQVFNALCTFMQNKREYFTVEQLYEVMTGSRNPTQKHIDSILNSLEYMNNTSLKINWEDLDIKEEYKDEIWWVSKTQSKIIDYQLLTLTNGNRKLKIIKLLDTSYLFQYSKVIGRIMTIKYSDVATPNLQNRNDVITAKEYLTRQIEWARRGDNKCKINLDNMYKDCNFEGMSVDEEKKRRKNIFKILDDWISNGFIKTYEKVNSGKKIQGIEIVV